jgi:hypothetical protein
MIANSKIRFIQAQLNERGLNAGAVDGVAGNRTFGAIAQIDAIPDNWSKKRKLVGFIQWLSRENGIDSGKLDGYWGPQTEYAYETLVEQLESGQTPEPWRPEEIGQDNPNDWPIQTPESEIRRYYGDPGENLGYVQLPYKHRLSWKLSTSISRFKCHERVADSIERVLTRVLNAYGEDDIKRLRLDIWGGCFSDRAMRGGTRKSMHSWGIAVDYDPVRNKLKWGRDRASFANPEYNTWWRLWEEEGWVSLGRARNFDWMHVQAARL